MFSRLNLLFLLLSQSMLLFSNPYLSMASENDDPDQLCGYGSTHPQCFMEVSQNLLKQPEIYQLKCYLKKQKNSKKCTVHLSGKQIKIESDIFSKEESGTELSQKSLAVDSTQLNLVRYLEYHKTLSLGQSAFGHDLNVGKKKYAKLVIKYSSDKGDLKNVVLYSRRSEINTLLDNILKQQNLSETCCIKNTRNSLPSLNLPPLSHKKPDPQVIIPSLKPFPITSANNKTTTKKTYNSKNFCNCPTSKTTDLQSSCRAEIDESI